MMAARRVAARNLAPLATRNDKGLSGTAKPLKRMVGVTRIELVTPTMST